MARKKQVTTVGWREWIGLPGLGIGWMKAKVDTGARTSALHAFDLKMFERDGETWAHFQVQPNKKFGRAGKSVEARIVDERSVKLSSGVTEVRPVIRTTLRIGTIEREIDLTLTRRDDMGFRMLLGREAIRGMFAVDPSRSFVTGVPPAKGQREALVVGGQAIAAGERQRVALPISKLATGTSQLALTLQVVHGAKPGPIVWINAAIHGDEINGVEIIRRVLEALDPATLRGTVIAVPVVNVHGFVSGDRYMPDRRDLNRSFPGSANGSLGRRIAYLMMTEVVARCSVGIDLHTGSDGRMNLPQVRANLDDPTTLNLARVFGAPVMLHSKPRDGSLRYAAAHEGATVLVFEAGEAWRFDRESTEVGTHGVLRVLAELGLIDPISPSATTRYRSEGSRWVRAARSGLAQMACTPGDLVTKGQVLGTIYDAFGDRLSTLKSPCAGLVLGHNMHPLVNRGDALIHVAKNVSEEPP